MRLYTIGHLSLNRGARLLGRFKEFWLIIKVALIWWVKRGTTSALSTSIIIARCLIYYFSTHWSKHLASSSWSYFIVQIRSINIYVIRGFFYIWFNLGSTNMLIFKLNVRISFLNSSKWISLLSMWCCIAYPLFQIISLNFYIRARNLDWCCRSS